MTAARPVAYEPSVTCRTVHKYMAESSRFHWQPACTSPTYMPPDVTYHHTYHVIHTIHTTPCITCLLYITYITLHSMLRMVYNMCMHTTHENVSILPLLPPSIESFTNYCTGNTLTTQISAVFTICMIVTHRWPTQDYQSSAKDIKGSQDGLNRWSAQGHRSSAQEKKGVYVRLRGMAAVLWACVQPLSLLWDSQCTVLHFQTSLQATFTSASLNKHVKHSLRSVTTWEPWNWKYNPFKIVELHHVWKKAGVRLCRPCAGLSTTLPALCSSRNRVYDMSLLGHIPWYSSWKHVYDTSLLGHVTSYSSRNCVSDTSLLGHVKWYS